MADQVLAHHSIAVVEYDGGPVVSFPAGTELPDWAWDQVKDKEHLHIPFSTDVQARRLPLPRERTGAVEETDSGKEPHTSKTEAEDDEDEALELPADGATKATWLKFAKEAEAAGYKVELTGNEDRDAVRDAVKAAVADTED